MQINKNDRVYVCKSLQHAVIYAFLVKEAACRPRTTSTPSTPPDATAVRGVLGVHVVRGRQAARLHQEGVDYGLLQ